MKVRDALKEARKSKGITQQELARITGLTRETIVRFESGTWFPCRRTIVKLSQALGVSRAEMLTIYADEARERIMQQGED